MESKYEIKKTSRFKKDFKRIKKRGYDLKLLQEIVDKLANGELLEEKYHDHQLIGNFAGLRECHIEPDWLLVYEVDNATLYLYLTRTGTR
jgi:mRNA interferase YafQ